MSNPAAIHRSHAAAVIGVSAKTLRKKFIAPGLLDCDDRGHVLLTSVEKFAGPVSAERLIAAQRRLQKPREYQKRYAADRRRREDHHVDCISG